MEKLWIEIEQLKHKTPINYKRIEELKAEIYEKGQKMASNILSLYLGSDTSNEVFEYNVEPDIDYCECKYPVEEIEFECSWCGKDIKSDF